MADLEFFRDEDGNCCVRGDDERFATFIQTDLQGSARVTSDLIELLENTGEHAEFHGNAHSLSISEKTVTIEANFDEDAPDRRIDREEMLRHLIAWREFLNPSDTKLT